jgi:hypothetical protein
MNPRVTIRGFQTINDRVMEYWEGSCMPGFSNCHSASKA